MEWYISWLLIIAKIIIILAIVGAFCWIGVGYVKEALKEKKENGKE